MLHRNPFRSFEARPCVSSDVAIEDWDLLFRSVMARLTSIFDGSEIAAGSARNRASVLECVEALDQLRKTMTHELGRRRQAAQ